MRSRLILVVFLGTLSFWLGAQNIHDLKRDYVMLSGYGGPTYPGHILSGLNFNSSPPTTFSMNKPINILCTNSSICDTSGNLLFFTNGMFVFDKNGNQMPHGDSINYNDYYDMLLGLPGGNYYPLSHSIVTLPSPNKSNEYYIIHQKYRHEGDRFIVYLNYSLIDMNLNNGLGDVVKKNIEILRYDTICRGIAATRHANGKDWWILARTQFKDQFYAVWLNDTGFSVNAQTITTLDPLKAVAGSALFSQDGSKYYELFDTINTQNKLRYLDSFDFDRINGKLLNYKRIQLSDSISMCGNVVTTLSPNGRYFYTGDGFKLYQFDLQAVDVPSSRILIANWDSTYINGDMTGFFFSTLGPDGKIYISNHTKYIHVINEPDSPGMLCDFVPYAILMPGFQAPFPVFPNFRLGPLVGIDEIYKPKPFTVQAFPNPSNSEISFSTQISNNTQPMQFQIINAIGQLVYSDYYAPFQTVIKVNISELADGIYEALFSDRNMVIGKTKFLVTH
jgi:hypothetical protein